MKSLSALIIIFTLLILLASPSFAFTGKIVKVTDGDTVQVLDNQNHITKVRLYGIDCPENSQAFGQKAKQFVLSLAGGEQVDVKAIDIDKYGRTVGVVTIGDNNGKILNEEILKAGLAWFYAQYCKESFCKAWQELESQAKLSKIGLWSDIHAVPPSEYRKNGSADTLADDKNTKGYHGNIDSLLFHKSNCKYFNCKRCSKVFTSKDEAVKSGYKPCKLCKP